MLHAALTYDGRAVGVVGGVLLVHDVVLLVSQHRKASCSCSWTGVELFPLGAGGVADGVELGRCGGHAAQGHIGKGAV